MSKTQWNYFEYRAYIRTTKKKPTENYLCCHVHVGSSKRFSTQTIFLRDYAEEWLYLCFSVCVCGKDVLCACVSLLQWVVSIALNCTKWKSHKLKGNNAERLAKSNHKQRCEKYVPEFTIPLGELAKRNRIWFGGPHSWKNNCQHDLNSSFLFNVGACTWDMFKCVSFLNFAQKTRNCTELDIYWYKYKS